jgi:hypothetical protein
MLKQAVTVTAAEIFVLSIIQRLPTTRSRQASGDRDSYQWSYPPVRVLRIDGDEPLIGQTREYSP